jgi:hypothetical protein
MDFYRPEAIEELASALGLQIEGKAAGLFQDQALSAVVGTGSALLFDRGYLKGQRVKVTNAGSGKLIVERLGGAPLTIRVQVMDFMRPESVEELASALGLQIEGKATGLFAKESLSAVVGSSAKLLFERGYLKGQRVKVTNAGGGKLTIERAGGAPLTIHVKVMDFMRPAGMEELASALGLRIEGKATGLFARQALNAAVGTGSKLLFDKGYLKGQRVKVINAGGGKLAIERAGGAPLTVRINMEDFFSVGR